MTILSSINDWIVGLTKKFEQGTPAPVPAPGPGPTKPLDQWLMFMAGLPYTQLAGAALAGGRNIPLDITVALAILADANKAFFSGHTVQTTTMAIAAKVGVPPVVAAQIVFDPVHPANPMQFSLGR